jgi:myo-inositol 2-dehydrogenase/D-chiro-inositol 1-dehydrogenase
MMRTSAAGQPVRLALIGSGRMGSFHGETISRRLPDARLVAVADPAPGAAARMAETLGAARAYTDPAQVFADAEIDAVVIAAPARFHADLVVAAATAGKHVFCEKPMALTLADVDRAIDAARTAGVVLQVGFNRRFAADWAPPVRCSTTVPSAPRGCCARSPATPADSTRPGYRRTRSSWRR